MVSLANTTGLIVGTIGIIVVAAVVATLNVAEVGALSITVAGFITVGMAVGLLILAFKG